MWLAAELIGRKVERRVLHGVLIGIFETALYIIVPLKLSALFGQVGSLPPEVEALAGVAVWLCPVSHSLKLMGDAHGGLFADRKKYGAPSIVRAQS